MHLKESTFKAMKGLTHRLMIKYLEFEPGMKSLELGCGGTDLCHVLERLGVEAWGVDLKQYPYPLKHFIKEDFLKVSLPENYFDLAIDMSSLHHFGVGYGSKGDDLDGDIKSSRKVWHSLKDNGVWYLTMDRLKKVFNPNVGNFVRAYTYDIFKERICEGFKIEFAKFYDPTKTMKEMPEGDFRGVIFIKLRKEGPK